ncbi:MAG: hypothetical protein RL625_768, partial [Gemmatimonadota bacterium]
PLHIALEHLEGEGDRPGAAPSDPFEDRRLELVGAGVVVLLTQEDEVLGGEPGDHRLEVDEPLRLGVVDAVEGVGLGAGLSAEDKQKNQI